MLLFTPTGHYTAEAIRIADDVRSRLQQVFEGEIGNYRAEDIAVVMRDIVAELEQKKTSQQVEHEYME
jgi:hypothetical protein